MAKARFGYGATWASRRVGSRQPAKVVVVAYDGEATEASYFRGWKAALGAAAITLEPIYVKSGGNTLSAVQEAVRVAKVRPEHDEFWCVCDVDDSTNDQVEQARALAKRNGLRLCVSKRSFEIWLGLHFQRSDRILISEADAVAYIQRFHGTYSARNKIVPFDLLLGRTEEACNNAVWLSERGVDDPVTQVHELVSELHKLLKNMA